MPNSMVVRSRLAGVSSVWTLSPGVKVMSNHLEERFCRLVSPYYISLQTGNLSSSSLWQGACSPLGVSFFTMRRGGQ